uniref:Uncharacterized protein n=1 Tax=Desertifilum tharense IPPAS B-1220 TaxID=1781255 RepID=A0ACD5GWX7_9CYAN
MRIMPEIKSHPCLLAPSQIQPHLPLFIFLPGMDGTGQLLRSQTSSLEQAFDVRCLAIPPTISTTGKPLANKSSN